MKDEILNKDNQRARCGGSPDLEREISVEFLQLINRSAGFDDLIKEAATFFREQSGCEAVGIRLKKGDDYPYYEARGFPKEFLKTEKNGMEAYEEIRKIAPDIKAIFMSGYSADTVHRKGIVEQSLNIVTKPVSPNVLLREVRKTLDKESKKNN